MLVLIYAYQNATLLEITCRGSFLQRVILIVMSHHAPDTLILNMIPRSFGPRHEKPCLRGF